MYYIAMGTEISNPLISNFFSKLACAAESFQISSRLWRLGRVLPGCLHVAYTSH